MKKTTFQKIINESKNEVRKLAAKNGWMWFYKMHQNEVVKYAEKLLKIYKEADKEIVLISCWLHDIGHYYAKNGKEILEVKKKHHINGAMIAENILRKYDISKEDIDKIKNCILRHRNHAPYVARTLEEKIVVAADTLSHFGSIFYFTYFKFHPNHSIEQMVQDDLEKMERDWRDLNILPKVKKMVETEYKTIKKLFKNYKQSL